MLTILLHGMQFYCTRKWPRRKGRTENTDDHDQGTIRISLYINSPNLWLTSKVTL